jgi:hypothetical protein
LDCVAVGHCIRSSEIVSFTSTVHE